MNISIYRINLCNVRGFSSYLALLFVMLLLISVTSKVVAAVEIPKIINYQGKISGSSEEKTKKIKESLKIDFALYRSETGGQALWAETHPTVNVSDGVFNVELGSIQEFDLPFDEIYYLGVQVEGDSEISPRKPLSTVAYAFLAARSVLALEAVIARNADRADLATRALNADRATNSDRADLATRALNADRATDSVRADLATRALDADRSTDSVRADLATRALNADRATDSVRADLATRALNADRATDSVRADLATRALDADRATNSDQADLATRALDADRATNSDQADLATRALDADRADLASDVADGSIQGSTDFDPADCESGQVYRKTDIGWECGSGEPVRIIQGTNVYDSSTQIPVSSLNNPEHNLANIVLTQPNTPYLIRGKSHLVRYPRISSPGSPQIVRYFECGLFIDTQRSSFDYSSVSVTWLSENNSDLLQLQSKTTRYEIMPPPNYNESILLENGDLEFTTRTFHFDAIVMFDGVSDLGLVARCDMLSDYQPGLNFIHESSSYYAMPISEVIQFPL